MYPEDLDNGIVGVRYYYLESGEKYCLIISQANVGFSQASSIISATWEGGVAVAQSQIQTGPGVATSNAGGC
jgi:hypothetical protein